MSRLRRSVQRDVIEKLDGSKFSAADFAVAFPDRGEILVEAQFLSNPNYKFQVLDPPNASKYRTLEVPGSYFIHSNFDGTLAECLARVGVWCDVLYDELRALCPIYDDFDQLRTEMDEKLKEQAGAGADGHFSRDEADALRARVEMLDARLAEHAELHVQHKAEIDTLRRNLATAKGSIESFEKATWIRTTFNKVASGLKSLVRTKEGRELATEVVRGMIRIGTDVELPK